MYTNYSAKVKTDIIEIFVGEYYATNKQEVISTLLGSCVSVCLIDDINKVYGMNHFLLPGNITTKEIYADNSARFGINSMELLINQMLKLGATKKNFKAKVFGGGKVLKTNADIICVNQDNIMFAHQFLEYEGIPIVSEDVGGTQGRIIYFDTSDASVYVEKVKASEETDKLPNKEQTAKKTQNNLELWD
jgi:chemotaxis protein CheD